MSTRGGGSLGRPEGQLHKDALCPDVQGGLAGFLGPQCPYRTHWLSDPQGVLTRAMVMSEQVVCPLLPLTLVNK